MASSVAIDVTDITVEGLTFPPAVVHPLGSHKSFFLGGAGVRGLLIEGEFVKFTAIGVYLEDAAAVELAHKWGAKSPGELAESLEFFRHIVNGPFEKLIHVSMIKNLSGPEFSRKVAGNCVAICKALETYTEAEEKAVQKFLEIFKNHHFSPGCSVMYRQSPLGSLTIAFGKHDSGVAGVTAAVVENEALSRAHLESIIGEDGVSPASKNSLATRLHQLLSLNQCLGSELVANEAA